MRALLVSTTQTLPLESAAIPLGSMAPLAILVGVPPAVGVEKTVAIPERDPVKKSVSAEPDVSTVMPRG